MGFHLFGSAGRLSLLAAGWHVEFFVNLHGTALVGSFVSSISSRLAGLAISSKLVYG
jgi:hypothetical protein